MNRKIIYFDHAATSGTKPPRVMKAMVDCLEKANANPGRSGHSLSLKAGEIIYNCREALGELFHFPHTENIILTKNATEALNLAIYGSLESGGEVVTTSMEHNSVLRPLNHLKEKGLIILRILEADANGLVTPHQIEEALSPRTRLIVITSASNVCGTKLDLAGIYHVASTFGIKLLVDGAQGGGAIKIDWGKTPFDFLALTGHKHLLGPQGTGALLVKNSCELSSLMQGGTGSLSEKTIQPDFPPDKFESGTLNTPGFAGLAAGVQYILEVGLENIIDREHQLTQYLLKGLLDIEELEVYAPEADRVATLSFNCKGVPASEITHYLDCEWGICSRPGLHCAPQAHITLGTFPQGTVRFSLSYFNTEDEIDTAIKALRVYARGYRKAGS